MPKGPITHFFHAYFYTHIFFNTVTFYNPRVNRPARVMMIYSNIFLNLIFTGVCYIIVGAKKDAGGLNHNVAFWFGIASLVFTRIFHTGLYMLFKSFGQSREMEYMDQQVQQKQKG